MSQHGTEVVDEMLGDVARLEDVVDREALAEVCRSFYDLFGLSIRILSAEGALLADVHEERQICAYVNTLPRGRSACLRTVAEVKAVRPRGATVVHPCFTGALYRIEPITYQGRTVGRFVVGPYFPYESRKVPETLLTIDPGVDAGAARDCLAEMPRVREETADKIAAHVGGVLDLLLFSSHRAHLTSEMHVASVRESYRELAEKTSKLQGAYDRLKELDRLKSNFLATISHELRTPLTSIIGYSEMLEAGIAGDLNEEQSDFVRTIHTKGEHLLQLISSLLDMSKLEQNTLSLSREPVSTADLLEQVRTNVAPLAKKKDIEVEVSIEDGLPPIWGDPVRLRQIVFNIADNAVKFTPPGGRLLLRATATELGDGGDEGMGLVLMAATKPAVCIEITDSGIGMPKDELPKIFDAFYQVDGGSTREYGGTGLGLSIVKRLVDAHEGTVAVDSQVGVGTTFKVTLPVVDDEVV